MKNVLRWLMFSLKGDRIYFSFKGTYTLKGASRLCVFASFDPGGKIRLDVVRYIQELRRAGFDIIFVSASCCPKEEFKKIAHYCRLMISRENRGYDFYSWKTGLKYATDIYKYEKLLLANDSVVGPFFSLNPIFEKMDRNPNYVWSLTDSYEKNVHHLQSYFLYFDRRVFNDRFFKKFWRKVKILPKKKEIIKRYELGLSKAIVNAGIPIHAIFSYDRLKRKIQQVDSECEHYQLALSKNVNPTLYLWDILIKYFDFPFIKKMLFRDNPNISISIKGWESLVRNGNKDVLESTLLFEKSIKK